MNPGNLRQAGPHQHLPGWLLFFRHTALLTAGAVLGFAAAYWLTSMEFDFSADVEEARRLGIVSLTVLEGYPKSRDVLDYLITLGLPVLSAMAVWWPWGRARRRELRQLSAGSQPEGRPASAAWRAELAVLLLLALYCAFSVGRLYLTAYDPFVGAWTLLGEEGLNLAWVQSILSGGVYGKDFACVYGPMLIYPLAWAMRLFGETVLVERAYALALNLVAHAIVIFFLYRVVCSRTVFLLGGVFYLFLFPAQLAVHPSGSYLRVALAILPMIFAYGYMDSRRPYLLPVCGLVVGQSLLFSQEAGLCSLLALLVLFLLYHGAGGEWKRAGQACLLFLAGVVISVAPMLFYLFMNDAFGPFIDSMVGYPRLFMLGYSAMPFPSFNWFIDNLDSNAAYLQFGIIFIYIFAAIQLLSRLMVGPVSPGLLIRITLLVFGVLLFRSALGRSDDFHALLAAPPAILLIILYIEDGFCLFRSHAQVGPRVAGLFFSFFVAGSVVAWIGATPFLKSMVTATRDDLMSMDAKWNLVPWGTRLPALARGGIYFPPQTAASIRKIQRFLEKRTKPEDYVYFFPNEAVYYFLFNRKNPTRYASPYIAITAEHRKELVAGLERNRPRYVVYSLKTWRMDEIRETIQAPEVVEYLRRTYRPALNMGDVVVLERTAGAASG
ncbi:MAG TPA: hypothetical protein ENI99_08790 [Sedimenticola sp.]|nr:hypothetical protein [Sedimenticola sp.]